ncbi:MAG: RNA 2',3'-cyclic phosphodiesterase [Longimicrobiales bacterium]
MVRAFIAINLPEGERARLWEALSILRDQELPVRWTVPDAIHLTVKFLGDVNEKRVPELRRRLCSVAERYPPFALSLGGLGAFPDVRHARIWWIGVRRIAVLSALHGALEASLDEAGFPRDDRPFSPHLTVGREKGDGRAAPDRRIREALTHVAYASTIDVREVDLMRSHLGGGAPRYERIVQAPLGPPGTTLELTS